MTITASDRESYHPAVDAPMRTSANQRDSSARLKLIERHVNFTGMTVIDLGCSGGFFSLSIAAKARHVIGVDSDEHIIRANISEAKRLGITNVDFVCRSIGPELIESLPHVNVVLFLSVFHHILAATDVYDGNSPMSEKDALLLLERISHLPDTYVFEMGEPWEPCGDAAWATRVRARTGDLDSWIPRYVFGDGYRQVDRLRGIAYQRWPFRTLPSLARLACGTGLGREFLRRSKISRSDFRNIWIGRR